MRNKLHLRLYYDEDRKTLSNKDRNALREWKLSSPADFVQPRKIVLGFRKKERVIITCVKRSTTMVLITKSRLRLNKQLTSSLAHT